ncbi:MULTISPECIES: restriction endonuclease subunit S [unclassified Microbacterium]|uniref:restriction endonuclease subunit S n=1 Tax=unclassified Microbacterium TaxID=2609290 RepID=UPI003466582B
MSWEKIRLRDLGTWYGGGTPSKSNPSFWTNGDVPWLSPKDMGPEILHSTTDHVTAAAVIGSSTKLVPEGSIAVVTRSGILERTIPVALVPFATAMNQDMKAVVPRDGIDPRWIAWGLRAFERDLLRDTRKAGTTVASIEMPRWYAFELPVPTLGEQRRIIAILEDHLSHLDAAESYIRQARRGVDTLRTVTLARLHEWPTASLASLATDAGYGTSEKCVAEGPGPAVVRIPNLVDGTIDLSDEKRVANSGADVAKSMLSEGDLLIVRTNGSLDLIGRSAVAPADLDAAFASYLIRYRLRSDLVRPQWVHAMLSTPQLRLRIEKLAASSAGQHNLSLGKLDSLAIPLPTLAEQDRLLDSFSSLDADRRRFSNAIASARLRSTALRRSLLLAAFSGRLTGSSTEMSEVAEMLDA